jgi:LuxR family maltose regulon positive regulatory protein
VPRPRLIGRLNAGLGRRLALISAPAGSGKTTLLSEWIDQIQNSHSIPTALEGPQSTFQDRIAWLSLDESDNDLARFLTYLIGALQTIEANIGTGVLGALHAPQYGE